MRIINLLMKLCINSFLISFTSVFTIIAFQYILVQPAAAGVPLDVDRFDDEPTATACTAAANDCSLRGAVETANNNMGMDTINLPAGTTYNLTNAAGELFISDDVEIIGLGTTSADTVIDASTLAVNDRVFEVDDAFFRTFKITITGGSADDGGAIIAFGTCEIIIEKTTISGNHADDDGGGILNECTLTILNSTISGNDAVENGGGINNDSGTVTIVNSTISGNDAGDDGGGIFNTNDGSIVIANTTITDNEAGSNGGGMENTDVDDNTIDLMNTIVAGNIDGDGSSGSTADCSQEIPITSSGFNIVGSGTGCPSDGTGDKTVLPADVCTTVIDCTLADNGGETFTHALIVNPNLSPAIDMGDPNGCNDPRNGILDEDQRQLTRPVDGDNADGARCDIGAYECQNIEGECPEPEAEGTVVIPTMGQWGMIVATILLGFLAVLKLRRRTES